MQLMDSGYQGGNHRAFRADGSLSTTAPKLILPRATSRSFLFFQNTGSNSIYLDHGCARATATLTNGVVTALTILNGGFGFTLPPLVQFKGGGILPTALAASEWDGRGQIDNWPTPSGSNLLVTPPTQFRIAKATAVLTAGVVTSFLISDGGAGYTNIPEVMLSNDPSDPFGCADPSLSSGSGLLVPAPTGVLPGEYVLNGTFCHTDPIAVYASAAAKYYLEYAP